MAWRESKLHDPLLVELERGDDSGLGKGIDRVEQRVRHVVVVRRELRLNAGHRKKATDADVQAGLDREIQVEIFEHRVKAVAAIEEEQLLTEVSLRCGEAVVVAVKRGEVIAPVEVAVLHRVRQTLEVNNRLIQHYA